MNLRLKVMVKKAGLPKPIPKKKFPSKGIFKGKKKHTKKMDFFKLADLPNQHQLAMNGLTNLKYLERPLDPIRHYEKAQMTICCCKSF